MSAWRKWLVIAAAMIPQIFVWGISVMAFALWTIPWMKTYSVSHGQMMATSMGVLFVMGCLSPLGGYMTEKFAVRDLLLGGLVLTALSFFLLSRATSMWQIMLLYALPLAGALMLTSPMMGQILAVKLFDPKPGVAIGVVTIGVPAGGIVAPLLVDKLLLAYGWRTSLDILAIVALALLPVVLILIPKLSTSSGVDSARRENPAATHLSIMAILTDRIFIGVVVLTATILLALYNALFFNLGPFMQDIGGTAANAAELLSIAAVPAFLGTILFAGLADRIDYRLILLLAAALVGAGMTAIAAGAGVSEMMFVMPMMAISSGGLVSLAPAILAQHFGQNNFARANGLSVPFFSCLAGLGPLIAGLGRDRFGSYSHTFAVMLGLMVFPLLGLLLVSTVGNRKEQSAPQLQKEF